MGIITIQSSMNIMCSHQERVFLFTKIVLIQIKKNSYTYLEELALEQGKEQVMFFKAITDCTLVVLLTKKWDDCDVPIVHENMGMGDGDHGDPKFTIL